MRLIEPAGDGIAGEANDTTAEDLDSGDEGSEHCVELSGQFLSAAARAKCSSQGFSQRGEARDIGEQHRALGTIRQGFATPQGAQPILRQIGVQIHSRWL